MSLRTGVFAKVWMGFKETTREDINHVTRNIRDLSPPQTQRDSTRTKKRGCIECCGLSWRALHDVTVWEPRD